VTVGVYYLIFFSGFNRRKCACWSKY